MTPHTSTPAVTVGSSMSDVEPSAVLIAASEQWAFTQQDPLSTSEFCREAEKRRLSLREEQLPDLWRVGALAPFVEIRSKPLHLGSPPKLGEPLFPGSWHLGELRQQREARGRTGKRFSSFLPAMSDAVKKTKGTELRRMSIHRRTNLTLDDLARWLNPIVRGWMNYYGRFYRSAMIPLLRRVSTYLMRWAWKKYRRLRTHKRFQMWWSGLLERAPDLFAHWRWVRAY